MLRFYGIELEDAFAKMSSDTFWSLTAVLAAYDGVVAALIKKETEKAKQDEAGVRLDAPELQGLISTVKVPKRED